MGGVDGPHPIGDERIEWLADQLAAPIPEQSFGLTVNKTDHTGSVDGNDGIRRSVEDTYVRLRAHLPIAAVAR